MAKNASESIHIKKARKKIEKHIKQAETNTTPESIHAAKILIQEHLNRQKDSRINLKKRHIYSQDSSEKQNKTISNLLAHLARENAVNDSLLKKHLKKT